MDFIIYVMIPSAEAQRPAQPGSTTGIAFSPRFGIMPAIPARKASGRPPGFEGACVESLSGRTPPAPSPSRFPPPPCTPATCCRGAAALG